MYSKHCRLHFLSGIARSFRCNLTDRKMMFFLYIRRLKKYILLDMTAQYYLRIPRFEAHTPKDTKALRYFDFHYTASDPSGINNPSLMEK